MIKMRLFLQLSEAQSTGLWRQPLPPETAARWRCVLLINININIININITTVSSV